MVNEPGESIRGTPTELVSKGVVIRSILPTDDSNRLWNISVKAMQAIDSRFPTTKNKTHADFDRPFDFYTKEHKGDFLVAEVNGEIVGFGGFIERPDAGTSVCEMVRLRVDPDFQRMGIGQKLVDEREKRAIHMGFTSAYVTTTNHNPAVLSLVEKNGYRITDSKSMPVSNFGSDLIVYTLKKSLEPKKTE